MILPARQTDREIDDCVGKWQPGEKLTCKRSRARERREAAAAAAAVGGGERFSVCASGGWEPRRCVWCVLVTAQQLHHMSAWEREKKGRGEAFPPPSSFHKQPRLAV